MFQSYRSALFVSVIAVFGWLFVSCGQETPVTLSNDVTVGIADPAFVHYEGTKKELLARPFRTSPGVCGSVGNSGGTISNGPVTLIIPSGALNETTDICISAVDPTTFIAEFTPDGQIFLQDVEMRWNLTGSSAEGQAENWITLWYNPSTQLWEPQATEPPISSNVTKTYIDHFSKYSGEIAP